MAAEVGARLHLDALLICLTAGVLLENALGVGGAAISRALAPAALPIFAVFFALAGARLNLHDLRTLWPVALAFTLVRAASLMGGARLGAEQLQRLRLITDLEAEDLDRHAAFDVDVLRLVDHPHAAGAEVGLQDVAVNRDARLQRADHQDPRSTAPTPQPSATPAAPSRSPTRSRTASARRGWATATASATSRSCVARPASAARR